MFKERAKMYWTKHNLQQTEVNPEGEGLKLISFE